MSPVTLRIERLLARYHGVTPAERERLDGVLTEVTGSALEHAVEPTDLGADVWAVCISELQVRVELGDTGIADCATSWALAILAALRDATDRPDDRTVVYRTEVDALVDLVRGVAAGDDRHGWAWRQVGLATSTAGPASVRRALLDGPHLAPAVLGAVGPEVVGAALAPGDLADVAARFAELCGPGGPAPVAGTEAGAPGDDVPGSDDETLAVLVATTIPGPVWGWARWQPERVALDLAVLATAIVAPLRARDAGFVATVARLAAGATEAGAPGEAEGPVRASSGTAAPPKRPVQERRGPDPAGTLHPEDGGDARPAVPDVRGKPEVARTRWGGVWFLVRALTDLDIVDALVGRGDVDAALVVTRIVEEVTSAPADDPSVRWLAGATDDAAPGPDDDDLVSQGVAAIRSWLAGRTLGRLDDDALDRLWVRPCVLSREAAEIVVEYSLEDVDTGVRAAGLDLDPGWVWWLGAFVRFRYV